MMALASALWIQAVLLIGWAAWMVWASTRIDPTPEPRIVSPYRDAPTPAPPTSSARRRRARIVVFGVGALVVEGILFSTPLTVATRGERVDAVIVDARSRSFGRSGHPEVVVEYLGRQYIADVSGWNVEDFSQRVGTRERVILLGEEVLLGDPPLFPIFHFLVATTFVLALLGLATGASAAPTRTRQLWRRVFARSQR